MSFQKPGSIDVLLCTFQRPQISETLASLDAQTLSAAPIRIIVADNDDTPSARAAVADAAARMQHPVTYLHAPARNISIARNACLDAARADWIAFIDDDETAAPDWLARLADRLDATGADGVFGPSQAVYSPEAPGWMRRQDHHSNIPVRRGGAVFTGHCCNAMLRWANAPWTDERFDIGRGRSGGEDTEFFFRLHRLGATYEIAEHARVYEPVAPDRLSVAWLRQRKFRMGQSYASSAQSPLQRIFLFASAGIKSMYCFAAARLTGDNDRKQFWKLRGALHAGVCSGCLRRRQAQIYGR